MSIFKENFPILILSLFLLRLLITGASIGDAIALIALSGIYGFFKYLEHMKQPDINAEVKAQLEQVKADMSEVKNVVNTMKLGNLRKF